MVIHWIQMPLRLALWGKLAIHWDFLNLIFFIYESIISNLNIIFNKFNLNNSLSVFVSLDMQSVLLRFYSTAYIKYQWIHYQITEGSVLFGFLGWHSGKEFVCQCRSCRIPGSGKSPGEGNGNPLEYCCLVNSMDGEPDGLQSTGLQRVGHDWALSSAVHLQYLYVTNGLFLSVKSLKSH